MIGKIIKDKREKLNLSQKDLAEKLNISIQRLNNFESEIRIPPLELLNKLSIVLDFSIDDYTKKYDYDLIIDITLFKEKLLSYRQTNNLTLINLSNKLNITRQTLSKYEKGLSYPNIDDYYLLCEKLNVSPSSLISYKINNSNKKNNKYSSYLYFIIIFIYTLSLMFKSLNQHQDLSNSNSNFITNFISSSSNENKNLPKDTLISSSTLNLINNSINEYNLYVNDNNDKQYTINFNDPNIENINFNYNDNILLPFYFDDLKYIDHYLLNNQKISRYFTITERSDITLTPVYKTYSNYLVSFKCHLDEMISYKYHIDEINKESSILFIPDLYNLIGTFEINSIPDHIDTLICNESYLTINLENISHIPNVIFVNSKSIEFINNKENKLNDIELVAINQHQNYNNSSTLMSCNINFLYIDSKEYFNNFIYFHNKINKIIFKNQSYLYKDKYFIEC